jgi:L-ribulose-5-phosphate 3-epimerase
MSQALGVCSWSLQAQSPADLRDLVVRTGCKAVQLHLDPLRTGEWDEVQTRDLLGEAGIAIASGMMTTAGEDYSSLSSIMQTGGIRPDATWAENLAAARENAQLAERLQLKLVTLHAGWIPHDHDDPERGTILQRLRTLIGVFSDHGIELGFETGQETASTLVGVLEELPAARVNFDPANMILYAMGDPHEALATLGPWVAQLHAKDATLTRTPGTWGCEVPLGSGEVDWRKFVEIAGSVCPHADIMIEREAGQQRVDDIITARQLLEPLLHLSHSSRGSRA